MTMHKILVVAAMLAVSGSAIAGKGTTPGGGTGSGGVISSGGATHAAFPSGVLFGVARVPGLYQRVLAMQGSVVLPNGDVVSPPLAAGDEEVKIQVTRQDIIVRMIEL